MKNMSIYKKMYFTFYTGIFYSVIYILYRSILYYNSIYNAKFV